MGRRNAKPAGVIPTTFEVAAKWKLPHGINSKLPHIQNFMTKKKTKNSFRIFKP